ncbi:MAG: hypothetical protein ACRDJW_20105 [Thermomicrobiales bacterium]
MPIARHRPAINRRGLIKGGALAGATAFLSAAPTAYAAEPVTFDVALDGRTMTINRLNPTEPVNPPMIGDTFVVFGSIYPAGTIDEGLAGPDQTGAIGCWVCRGTFIVDVASGATPHVATGVLFAFGEGLSAASRQLDTALDGLLIDGVEGGVDEVPRPVAGGFGRYAGARGEVVQTLRGENDTLIQLAPDVAVSAWNYTFRFTIEPR